MSDDMIALGKRAVACKGWRWTPGMRTTDAMRVIHDPYRWPDRPCAIREGTWIDTALPRPLGDDLPDLSDPATLGCLLALVRETWDDQLLGVAFDFDGGEWCVRLWNGSSLGKGFGKTEAEALVAALEGAPEHG